jgi:hypothetical protein
MPVSDLKQVAQPYTQNSDGSHASVYTVGGIASTSHVIATSTTAVEIVIALSTNYTLHTTEDTTIEIAKSNGNPGDTVTVTAATANSALLPADQIVNFYFAAGSKISVRSGTSGSLTLIPSVQ